MGGILVTGAFGNVGQSVLAALTENGEEVTAFEFPSSKNRSFARTLGKGITVRWGDIRNRAAVTEAAYGNDAVIHLAAIIPPMADKAPEFAATVNVGGIKNVIAACETSGARLVHASSIALYGDRVASLYIRVGDPVRPSDGDVYGFQKAEAEDLLRHSTCAWTILRLSYVVWRKKLALDPLMFRMPLATKVEIVHTEDAGRAFANASRAPGVEGKTFNIGGGERCRTGYREYLASMLALFGLGKAGSIPDEAFSKKGYHCGWLDTEESERLLEYQRKTLADYYVEVAEESRVAGFFAAMAGRLVIRAITSRSPYFAAFRTEAARTRT